VQPNPPARDREIVSVFAGAARDLDPLISRCGLTPEEADEFKQVLFLWFHAFTRRPGNQAKPVTLFAPTLLEAARMYVGSFHNGNGSRPADADSEVPVQEGNREVDPSDDRGED